MLIPTANGFRIQGAVNFNNIVRTRLMCEQWMKEHASLHSFVIDLSEMKDQDASCFSLLLSLQRTAHKNNLTFSLTNIPLSMQRMAKMFGLSDVIFNG